ncbi:hypothetical protein ILYODFUR_034071 [Ilyodon furcidens]|uniref:Uncharacterized protein n=1 Tax=Ilyodon furcidens TaxID=33524 RepID=A0ABV0SU06_9TELE
MATAVMEAFPDKPRMTFLTTKPDIVKGHVSFALQILESSDNWLLTWTTTVRCAQHPNHQCRGQLSLTGFMHSVVPFTMHEHGSCRGARKGENSVGLPVVSLTKVFIVFRF